MEDVCLAFVDSWFQPCFQIPMALPFTAKTYSLSFCVNDMNFVFVMPFASVSSLKKQAVEVPS